MSLQVIKWFNGSFADGDLAAKLLFLVPLQGLYDVFVGIRISTLLAEREPRHAFYS
jgi:hypothetical protein